MSDEGFFRRWARRKTEVLEGREPSPEDAPAASPLSSPVAAPVFAPVANGGEGQAVAIAVPQPELAPPPPTLADVAALDKDSDFSAFVARGVDQAVRRGALKKLFADPHFNVMDKLDVYIDDYNKPSPMSEAMLASLQHAKSVFMKMVEDEPEAVPETVPEAATQAQPQQPPEQETQ